MSILRFAFTNRLFKGRVLLQRIDKFSTTSGSGKPPNNGNEGDKNNDGKDENSVFDDTSKSKQFCYFLPMLVLFSIEVKNYYLFAYKS